MSLLNSLQWFSCQENRIVGEKNPWDAGRDEQKEEGQHSCCVCSVLAVVRDCNPTPSSYFGTFYEPPWWHKLLWSRPVYFKSSACLIKSKSSLLFPLSHPLPCVCLQLPILKYIYTLYLPPSDLLSLHLCSFLSPVGCSVASLWPFFQRHLPKSVCRFQTVFTTRQINSNRSYVCMCMITIRKEKLNLAAKCSYHVEGKEQLGVEDERWCGELKSLTRLQFIKCVLLLFSISSNKRYVLAEKPINKNTKP